MVRDFSIYISNHVEREIALVSDPGIRTMSMAMINVLKNNATTHPDILIYGKPNRSISQAMALKIAYH